LAEREIGAAVDILMDTLSKASREPKHQHQMMQEVTARATSITPKRRKRQKERREEQAASRKVRDTQH
jgi:prefoldin subunit 5